MHAIENLIYYGIAKLFSVAKTELRLMSAELTLPFGADISKDDLISNVSNAIINKDANLINLILDLIEK